MAFIIIIIATLVSNNPQNMSNSSPPVEGHGITLKIGELRNHEGLIRIGFYYERKEFTDNPTGSYQFRKDTITSDNLICILKDIPAGTYAISVLDDENEDNKMNYRMAVWPNEGFGFSNNPMVKRPVKPKYEDISFEYDGKSKLVEIKIVYF